MMGNKEQKCLVKEAKEKCMCDWCKDMRRIEQINIEAIYKWELYKIWREVFQGVDKNNKKEKLNDGKRI